MMTAQLSRIAWKRLAARQSLDTIRNVQMTTISATFSTHARFASQNEPPRMEEFADRCNEHIVQSLYPNISAPEANTNLADFITTDWAANGGFIRANKTAILDGTNGMSRTFGDHHSAMTNIAASLRYEYDVDENSTVALFAPNHVDYLPICLAISLCGAKIAPINPLYTSQELQVILLRSKTTLLITHTSNLGPALQAVKASDRPIRVVILTNDETDSVPEGTVSLESLKHHDNHSKMNKSTLAIQQAVEERPLLLPYSSGTTGLPKGVCLTHRNTVVNLLQLEITENIGFPMDHKLICPLPFFHIYGLVVSLFYCAWKGQELITMSGRFDLERFCHLVHEHQPQRAHLVPPIILALSKHPVVDNYNMKSLQQIVSAAAPLSSHIELAAKERFSCEIKQGWGMSELSPLGTMSSDFNSKVGSIGPLTPSTFGKIVDEHGISQPAHLAGELLIKGPQVMMGYLDDPEKTNECLSTSGWLRTGDVAFYDEDGYFYITDRLKEMISVRGLKVAPAELEALLLKHDNVQDAAVIQVSDETSGELPRAYVVLKPDNVSQQVTTDDLKKWVKDQVAPYKRLDGGVVFVEEIPKSSSGKILRRILREQVHTEFASETKLQV